MDYWSLLCPVSLFLVFSLQCSFSPLSPWTGLGLAVFGSIGLNLGNNLQSIALQTMEKVEREKVSPTTQYTHTYAHDLATNTHHLHATNQAKLSGEPVKPAVSCKSPLWIFGTVVFILASGLRTTVGVTCWSMQCLLYVSCYMFIYLQLSLSF
jgi:hypothetical protein